MKLSSFFIQIGFFFVLGGLLFVNVVVSHRSSELKRKFKSLEKEQEFLLRENKKVLVQIEELESLEAVDAWAKEHQLEFLSPGLSTFHVVIENSQD